MAGFLDGSQHACSVKLIKYLLNTKSAPDILHLGTEMKMALSKHWLYLPVVYGQCDVSLFLLLAIGNLTLFTIRFKDLFCAYVDP